MSPNPNDQPLRALFSELRRADEAGAPSFDRMQAGAKRLRTMSVLGQVRFVRLGAAVAAAVIIAMTVGILAHRPAHKSPIVKLGPAPAATGIDPVADQAAMTLVNWQSPTAFLLRGPDEWDQPAESSDDVAPTTQPRRPT